VVERPDLAPRASRRRVRGVWSCDAPAGALLRSLRQGPFLAGASEEVELPAGRTVRVAEGLMLARYDPACPAWRLRAEAVGGVIDRASYPVLILVDVGESRARENLIVLRALSPSGIALSWGPGFELLPLEVDSDALRLLIRRHA